MTDEILRYYLKAGRIAAKSIDYARSMIEGRGEKNIYEICERVERRIVDLGGLPAFPCNIGVNEVAAHFSPYPTDEVYLPDEGIVKVDLGVRVNGYIVDTAISIALSKEYREMVECVRKALEEAVRIMRPGVSSSKIGGVVEDVAKERGFKTIRNLSGHLIREYSLHAGKSIPNVRTLLSHRLVKGEIYAVEPFVTFSDAAGYVKPRDEVRIFSVRRVKKPRSRAVLKLYEEVFRRFKTLPFTPRWLVDIEPFEKVVEELNVLLREKILQKYPVLVEVKGGFVAQYEHTVLVGERPVVLTKA